MRYDDAVVVGVDGYEPDRRLVHWAAREAMDRRRPLIVCHVVEWSSTDRALSPIPDDTLAAGYPMNSPEKLVFDAVVSARADLPQRQVSGAVGYGRPVPLLIEASDGAGMLVVGARGSGGFAGLPLGSVSAQLAAHARCPVAVVRGNYDDGIAVVVGVDGSATSDQALWLGVAEARRTGGALVAVHGYRLPPLAARYGPHPGIDAEGRRSEAEALLDRALQDVETRAPDVKIERRVVAGPPARTLIDASYGAAVLIVGRRGLGGFTGLLLGSVSQQVVGHAACPVIVAGPVDVPG